MIKLPQHFEMPKNNVELIQRLDELHAPLNNSQYDAAMAVKGPVMVIAGAGTGKTKTLIHRVATLMMRGVPATEIMIVTFTTKAAGEIKDRLQTMVGENAQYVHAGTFHSIIYQKVLSAFPESQYLLSLGINMAECSIMDEDDAKSLLKTAMQSIDESEIAYLEENDFTLGHVQSEMSKARAIGSEASDYARMIHGNGDKERLKRIVGNIWSKYNDLCRQASGIDFDDILVFADKMLKKEPEKAEELSRTFKYLMLDEYQDTNKVQMSIMDQIASYHNNIFVVGDEKQSIYGFRSADIGVILSFKERYKDAVQINMNENYRSYPAIIEASNACAFHMRQKLSDGQLIAKRGAEENPGDINKRKLNTVRFVEFATSRDEAKIVVDAIQRDISMGTRPDSIAVLYRNKSLKAEVEKELVRRDLEYSVVGDRTFYQRAEVKDAVALLRFTYHPWDSMAGLRILKTTTLGFSEKKAKEMMKENGANFTEVLRVASEQRLQALKKGESEKPLTASAKKIKPFYQLTKMLRESYEFGDDVDYIMTCLHKMWDIYLKPRYEAKISKTKNAKNADAMSDVIENAKFIFDSVRERLTDGMKMKEIIDELTMRAEYNSEVDRKKALRVQLLTMHGSKGLEYDSVYIVGCNNIIMPGETDDPMVIEEERRLAYVGATRAAKKLAMTYARKYYSYGEWKQVSSSPFIDEMVTSLGIEKTIMPETDLERQVMISQSSVSSLDKKTESEIDYSSMSMS